MQKQQTVNKKYAFEGKGLHTGKVARMTVGPAPADYGIRFLRTDIDGAIPVEALSCNVSNTARSMSISDGISTVMTIEHLLSALTGIGVDNALIELDNIEVPILDGSAKPYLDSISKDSLIRQDAPRRWVTIEKEVVIEDPASGSIVKVEPAEEFSYNVTIDFNSKVLGIQKSEWNDSVDYASQIGVCRTFVFFHEIEFLFKNNLIKGGDVDNAIVIVENPVSEEQLAHIASIFSRPVIKRCDNGYLDNLQLRFDNECARHKLLDLIGDFRLCGGFLKAKVTAVKSGHTINSKAAEAVRQLASEIR